MSKFKVSIKSKMPVSHSSMGAKALLLFSMPFLLIGIYLSGMSLGYFPITGELNAPLAVIFICGLVFFLSGLIVFINSIFMLLKASKLDKLKFRFSLQKYKWDYDWEMKGIKARSANSIFSHFMGVTITLSFLAITYWLGFMTKDGFKIPFYGMSLFSSFIFFWLYSLAHKRIKYGKAFVKFQNFPFILGKKATIEFQNLPRKELVKSVEINLRFYEEVFSTNSQNQRVISLSEKYIDTIEVNSEKISFDRKLNIEFNLPGNLEFETCLSEKPSKFWEVQIICDIKGIDYREYFLLPVYATK